MTEAKPSVALIARGECPGMTYSGDYEADQTYSRRGCGRKITRGDVCGVCDNKRKRVIAANERREADREARRVANMEQSIALNVATMLTDELNRRLAGSKFRGVQFTANRGHVELSRDDARLLLNWFNSIT